MSYSSLSPTGPFLDLSPPFSELETASLCILPVPYDSTASYRPGARFGPCALIAASHQVEVFDEYLQRDTYRAGIHTCQTVAPNAAGPESMIADIHRACAPLLDREKFIALVGGDHSVTLGAIEALVKKRAGRPFGVIQFDAHRDLREDYDSSRYSHACVAARIVERKLPLVQLGIRSWSREEEDRGKEACLAAFTARELLENDCFPQLDDATAKLPEDVYLTFDVDVLDPSIMPSTGTPEPGGLSWYRTLDLLERLARQRNIIGLDLVELSPIAGLSAPDVLAARLLYRLLGFVVRDRPLMKEDG